jgi:hypothetical protein
VQEQQFAAVREPATGKQLVRYQAAREQTNEGGAIVRSMEQWAGLKAIGRIAKACGIGNGEPRPAASTWCKL